MFISRPIARKLIREYLNTNNCLFTAIIEHSIGWTEAFTTEAEAVTTLRELVEADGHHIFMKQTQFDHGDYGEKETIFCKLQWVNTLTGKTLSKRIRVNVKMSEIPAVQTYLEEQEKIRQTNLRKMYPWRYED